MSNPRIVWNALKGSQQLALACPCNHILYEGTRGPGKTDTQLMKFRSYVGQGFGRFWRGVIFDKEYKNLDDLVAKSIRWFNEFGDGAKFLSSTKDYKWVWPTGEELLFRSAVDERDYWKFHGQEFPFIGWNELTKYPTRKLYDLMMSCNRSSFTPTKDSPRNAENIITKLMPDIPLIVFSTTNPYGAGHNWVKAEFIDECDAGVVQKKTINVYNPRTQKREDISTTRTRIFGSYKENIYLPPLYVAGLESISEPNRRRAWLWGDWDIVAGGAIDDLWNAKVHIIPRSRVPRSFFTNRTLDWGSSKPFAVCWWAEATGEEMTLSNGKTFAPVKGSLILFHEWYGSKGVGTNEGLLLSSSAVAHGIKIREKLLMDDKWILDAPSAGPADNQIATSTDKQNETIKVIMANNGVHWTPSNKAPGSRKLGLQALRNRLEASLINTLGIEAVMGEGGVRGQIYADMTEDARNLIVEKMENAPGIYIMSHCRHAIATLPVLPRDSDDMDDVDTESEDHIYDAVRYRCMQGNNRFAEEITLELPT